MNKHEIIEKKQKEFNDYTMEFADKIEYDLDLGFTPAQLDKYLCREYTPFVRDTIRFAMLFSPSAEKVDKLIELLTKENGKISNVGKIFKYVGETFYPQGQVTPKSIGSPLDPPPSHQL